MTGEGDGDNSGVGLPAMVAATAAASLAFRPAGSRVEGAGAGLVPTKPAGGEDPTAPCFNTASWRLYSLSASAVWMMVAD